MSKNQSIEMQQIALAKEELELKKLLIEKMEKSDKDFNEKMTKTMETVGYAITQSYQLLNTFLNPMSMINPMFNVDTNNTQVMNDNLETVFPNNSSS